MNYRISDLEARRRALLRRCEEQRLELAYRVSQIRPAAQLSAWTRRKGAGRAAGNPIAWITGLAGLLLMFKRRRIASRIGLIGGLVGLASRATMLLRLVAQLRAVYLAVKAPKK